MIKTRNLKFYLFIYLICCSFVSEAAFISHQDSSIITDNFLLLTPLKKSFSDRVGLRTKGHLMIYEKERIKYTLKDGRGSKRGEIIHIMDNEIQVYNQVTGKVDYIDVDNIKSIRRFYDWKAWVGFILGYNAVNLLTFGSIALIIGLISLVINLASNGFNSSNVFNDFGILALLYGTIATLTGIGTAYASKNILYNTYFV